MNLHKKFFEFPPRCTNVIRIIENISSSNRIDNNNIKRKHDWPGVNFTNILHAAFTLVDPESIKNTVKSSVSVYAFGICKRKSCTYNVDEIEPRMMKIQLTEVSGVGRLKKMSQTSSPKIPYMRFVFEKISKFSYLK